MTKYICRRCGSPVIRWREGWKHANGGHSETRSCGKKPDVANREQYEAEMALLARFAQRIGEKV
jgi:hypothetical protein